MNDETQRKYLQSVNTYGTHRVVAYRLRALFSATTSGCCLCHFILVTPRRAPYFCGSQVAHVMNDETQRKYLQSVKRLMTFAQRALPPSGPSMMVG